MNRLAIINPRSANGRTGRMLSSILDSLDRLADTSIVTGYRGHAVTIASRETGYDMVIAVGGDGTICEILRGMDRTRQSLAIVPSGTGNSLARDLGIHSIDDAVRSLRDGGVRRTDLLKVEMIREDGSRDEWYSSSTVATGYTAKVVVRANKSLKLLGPLFCYPVSAITSTISMKAAPFEIAYDKSVPENAVLTGIMVGNTRHAANFEAFPGAVIDDGLMDVMELDTGFWGQNMHNFSVLSHRHFYRPRSLRKARSLDIRMGKSEDLLIDGEIVNGVVRCVISVEPAGIRCQCIR